MDDEFKKEAGRWGFENNAPWSQDPKSAYIITISKLVPMTERYATGAGVKTGPDRYCRVQGKVEWWKETRAVAFDVCRMLNNGEDPTTKYTINFNTERLNVGKKMAEKVAVELAHYISPSKVPDI